MPAPPPLCWLCGQPVLISQASIQAPNCGKTAHYACVTARQTANKAASAPCSPPPTSPPVQQPLFPAPVQLRMFEEQ
jgi:predicted RNA-binding Zn-ribbon protein involved in translation (DUF1610 family)